MSEVEDPRKERKERYLARQVEYLAEHARLHRRSRALSRMRLLLFGGLVAGLTVGLWDMQAVGWPWLLAAAACLLGFIVTAVVHGEVLELELRAEDMKTMCAQALARMERRWSDLPDQAAPLDLSPEEEELAEDLDLFTPRGLIKLFGLQAVDGARLLGRWLVAGVGRRQIADRQEAVAELASKWSLRAEYGHRSRRLRADPDCRPDLLANWAESERWLHSRPWLLWTARANTLMTLTLIGLQAGGLLQFHWWLAGVFLSVVLTFVFLGPMQRSFSALAQGRRCFGGQARRREVLVEAELESPMLQALRDGLANKGKSAPKALRALDRLLSFAEVRLSAMAHAPLQAVLMWDFHLMQAMESWRKRHGQGVRQWLDAMAEFEALCAMGALHDEQPDWSFPKLDEESSSLKLKALLHPLLPPDKAVANDLELGPAGGFLLVTGSNMSGKSTLLRAVGLNVLMAQAGAPVAAESFHLPPLMLGTSFRIRDSVSDGVSFFLAELKRLKSVVDRAELAQAESKRLLYLFDEILLGTNVFERQVAVQRVVGHLVEAGALGAVATHDLSLADAPALQQACHSVHLREQFEDGPDGTVMRFDYKLRPGVTPTTNALKLLELVGLPAREP